MLILVGFVIFLYCYFRQPDLIKVQWEQVAKFTAFLALVMAVRFGVLDLLPQLLQDQTPIDFYRLPLVFWEDSFFAIGGIYYFKDYLKLGKVFWIPIAVLFSLAFGMGHMYQGIHAAIITAFAPYFISYNFGKKYGFGTCMVSHILYDFTTLLTIKLFTIIKLAGV